MAILRAKAATAFIAS